MIDGGRMARRKSKKRSAVDSAVHNAALLSDGCNPEFVKGATFDGIFEVPIIKRPKKLIIPDGLVPFSKMERADKSKFAVCTYENDNEFSDLLSHPNEYIDILKQYQGFIAPDCSVYRDMPLAAQITNIYRSRAIGYCLQAHGVNVIPCVRWGDERTYTTSQLPEKIAFLGIEKHSIVSIGSYGQLKDKVNRYYFSAGFDSMMETLEPEVVLVYSKLPAEYKQPYSNTRFVEYEDWTSIVRND